MSEIKRYAHKWDQTGMTRAFESPNGEWVRWEDVEKLQKSFIDKHHQVVNEITEVYLKLISGTFKTMSYTMEVMEPQEMPK